MIGTIVNAEVRETRMHPHYHYLVITFLDDYETKQYMYISPLAEHRFKEFCEMTKWDYNSFLEELKGKIISVDSQRERFQNRMITRWFTRTDWTEGIF